jgi:hypothetical protein
MMIGLKWKGAHGYEGSRSVLADGYRVDAG